MPDGNLFAIVSGRSWAAIPGGERRARRVLSRLKAQLLPSSSAAEKAWTPAVTHVIAPTASRSVLWVCASASASAVLLTPAYISACEEANALVLCGPYEYSERQAVAAPRTPRLWLGALHLWKRVGPPLRGHRVAVVAELCPPGANVPSSAVVTLMLRAAGATLCSLDDNPTFALAPPGLFASPGAFSSSVPGNVRGAVHFCLRHSILCLGAAVVPDLIARAEVTMAEYVVFPEQVSIAVARINPSSYDLLPSGRPVPVTLTKPAELDNVVAADPPLDSPRVATDSPIKKVCPRLSSDPVVVGAKENAKPTTPLLTDIADHCVSSDAQPCIPQDENRPALGATDATDSASGAPRTNWAGVRGSTRKRAASELSADGQRGGSSTKQCVRDTSGANLPAVVVEPPKVEQNVWGDVPRRSRRRVVLETPPSDSESEGHQMDGFPEQLAAVNTEECPPNALERSEPFDEVEGANTGQTGSVSHFRGNEEHDSSQVPDFRGEDGSSHTPAASAAAAGRMESVPGSECNPRGKKTSLSTVAVPRRRRVRCSTPGNDATAMPETEPNTLCGKRRNCEIKSPPLPRSLDPSALSNADFSALEGSFISAPHRPALPRVATAMDENAATKNLSDVSEKSSFEFVLASLGGAPRKEDIHNLLEKNRRSPSTTGRSNDGDSFQEDCGARRFRNPVDARNGVLEPEPRSNSQISPSDPCEQDVYRSSVGSVPSPRIADGREFNSPTRATGCGRGATVVGSAREIDGLRGDVGCSPALSPSISLAQPTTTVGRRPLTSRRTLQPSLTGRDSADIVEGNRADDIRCESELRDVFYLLATDGLVTFPMPAFCADDGARRGSLVRQATTLLCDTESLCAVLVSNCVGCSLSARRRGVLVLLAYALRLLHLNPSSQSVSSLLLELLEVRERQMCRDGAESISLVHSSVALPHVAFRDHAVTELWVQVLQYCENPTGPVGSFWAVFNVAAEHLRTRHANTLYGGGPLVPTRSVCNGGSNAGKPTLSITKWEEWCFGAFTTFGNLFMYDLGAASLSGGDKGGCDDLDSPKLSFAPNWVLVESLFESLRREYRVVPGAPTSPASTAEVSVQKSRLFGILSAITLDIAASLWHLEEAVVLSAIDVLHGYYVSLGELCSCSSSPIFLMHLRHHQDARLRRPFLSTQLKTPCDCVFLLVWLYVAQSRDVKKVPKIVQKADTFLKACSTFADVGGKSSGFRHYYALLLALGDSFVTPSDSTAGPDQADAGLVRLIFSKAPDVSRAFKNSALFGYSEISRWIIMLEAIEFRCQCLAASNASISLHVGRVALEFVKLSRCLDHSDEHGDNSALVRDSVRIQGRLLVDIAVKMLDVVSGLLVKQGQRTETTRRDGYSDLAAGVGNGYARSLDASLASVASMVHASGVLLTGVLAKIRFPGRKPGSGPSRSRLFQSLLRLVGESIHFCVLVRRWGPVGIQLRGMKSVILAFQETCFPGFIDVARHGNLLNGNSHSRDLAALAVRALARVVGLSALDPSTSLESGEARGSCSNQVTTLSIVERVGMNCLADIDSMIASGSLGASSTAGALGRALQESALMSSSDGRRLTAEFWSILVDTLWLDAVFDISPLLERTVISSWVVLLSAPEVVTAPLPLLSLAWALKNACDTRRCFAMFFRNTQLHANMGSAYPSMSPVLLAHRTQTVSDSLEVVLDQGFLPVGKVRGFLALLTAVACDGGMESSNPAWTSEPGEAAVARSSRRDPRTTEYMRHHNSFISDLCALVFCVRTARCQSLESFKSKAVEETRSLLEAVVAALQRIRDDFPGSVQSPSGTEPDVSGMLSRVAALVLYGLASLGYSHDVQLKSQVQKFCRLFPESAFGLLVRPLSQLPLALWVLSFGKSNARAREVTGSCDTGVPEEASRWSADRRVAGEGWRQFIIQFRILDPLQSLPISDLGYFRAAKRLYSLLEEHDLAKTDAASVAKDVREPLSRISQGLASAVSLNDNSGSRTTFDRQAGSAALGSPATGQQPDRTTLWVCQEMADKIDMMFSKDFALAERTSHAKMLLGQSTAIGQLTQALL